MSEQRDGTGTGTGVWTHQAAETGQPEQPEHRAIVKLTDADGYTGRKCIPPKPLRWGPGVTHTVPLWSGAMCQSGVLHCYEARGLRDALALAILRDPQDGKFGPTARAWVCDGAGRRLSNGIKSGYETLTTVREIPLPEVTTEQRMECAILLAWEVYDEPGWRAWAQAWLDGADRTEAGATRAAARAEARADARTRAAARADARTRAAEWAAEWAASAAWAAAWAAAEWASEAAEWAAWAAEWASEAADAGVDVVAIAGSVMLPEWVDSEEADGDE